MSVELKPIKTKKIYEEIIEQIKQLILDGHLKPGDKLPSERNLVDSFKVSRSSIREALSALEMMGLVEVRTGEGAYIRRLQANSMNTSFHWLLSLERECVLELLEVRRMIEVQAVEYATKRATDQELQQLERVLDSMKLNLHIQGSPWEEADHQFHYTIAKATHNSITIRLMDTISDHLQYLIRISRSKLYEGKYTPELLYQEHVDIFEAIAERDSLKAKENMLKHLTGVEEVILDVFIQTDYFFEKEI